MKGKFWLVEKKNHAVVHGLFYLREAGELYLKHKVPQYCKRGYYKDKALKPEDFEIIEAPQPLRRNK